MFLNRKYVDKINTLGVGYSSTENCELFSKLYNMLYEPIKCILTQRYSNVLSCSDIDDVLSETFIDVYTNAPKYYNEEKGDFFFWACAVAKRRAQNYITNVIKKRNLVNSINDIDIPANEPEFDTCYDELTYAIMNISDTKRNILISYIVNGETCKDISKKMGVSNAYIYSELNKAKKELFDIIKNIEPELMVFTRWE